MMKYCHRCGKMSEIEGEIKFCPHCGVSFEDAQQPTGQPGETPHVPGPAQTRASGSATEKYTPWEDREKLGLIGSLFETWKESVFNPTRFYKRMPVIGGIGNPLLYGLILGFIGLVFQMVYQRFFGQLLGPSQWYPFLGEDFDYNFYDFSHKLQSISNLVNIVIFPFLLVAWLFIWSGITHLILLIFGWHKEGFEATFRLIAYSEGPSFFAIVPIMGSLISIVWQAVLVIIGVKEVHRLSIGQSLLVIFLPLVLCCLCCCGFASMFFGLIGMAD